MHHIVTLKIANLFYDLRKDVIVYIKKKYLIKEHFSFNSAVSNVRQQTFAILFKF